jgi:Tfp pilus assembly protein PilN
MAELNLLPKHLKEKNQQRIKIRNYILMGLAGACLFVFFMYIPFVRLIKVKIVESQYKKQVDIINSKAISEESANIKKEIEGYQQYIDKVDYLTQNKVIVTDKLHELEQYVPEDVVFDSLTYNKSGLTIAATAQSMDSISEFAANLQASNNYSDVRISSITIENQDAGNNKATESYKFTINAVK